MRTEYSHDFYREFLKNHIGQRDFAMTIIPDEIDYFPSNNLDRHRSIILIDMNCENASRLLDKVYLHTSFRISKYYSDLSAQALGKFRCQYKWIVVGKFIENVSYFLSIVKLEYLNVYKSKIPIILYTKRSFV